MLASQANPIADDDSVLDDLFHGYTFAALVDQAKDWHAKQPAARRSPKANRRGLPVRLRPSRQSSPPTSNAAMRPVMAAMNPKATGQ
jgi:hypothetical protein